MTNPLLLIIDDDEEFISDFTLVLENEFKCISATDVEKGLEMVRTKNPDIVFLDLMLGEGINGLDVLRKILMIDEDLPVILVTDYAEVDTAVEAMKIGAENYISKTPRLKELKLKIAYSLENRILKSRARSLEKEFQKPYKQIIGESRLVKELRETIYLFAKNENTILITGESGVGKELVARQIHVHSKRKQKPFTTVNCAAIPKELLESELFGHEKGSFTSADRRKLGKFEIANDGTIFLDEISEMDLNSQVKILRVLQEKEFERVGGTSPIQSSARVIAATNKDLEELVAKGKFREDLYYRLDVLPIHVPPLRERKDDISLLIDHFLEIASYELKLPLKVFSEDAVNIFTKYDWPGNIRELQNYITRAVILSSNTIIEPRDLDPNLLIDKAMPEVKMKRIPETWQEMDRVRKDAADKASRAVEKVFLQNLLIKFDGNVTQAAKHVGINRTNFHKMMKKCGL